MATLATIFDHSSSTPAVLVPQKPTHLQFTYSQLSAHVASFQRALARLGIAPHAAVSIALPNSYEFIVSFLATSWQRAIAAPLNSAYKQDEFEFYIDDLSSALALVPPGAVKDNAPSVRAARKYKAAIAEVFWDGKEVVLDVKDQGELKGQPVQRVASAQCDDVALVLHTSGTTGRPKAVPLTHRNLTRTVANIIATYNLSPSDRTLLVMPLFHVHGLLAAFLAPLGSGGSLIVPERFSASDFWSNFVKFNANWYTAVPTIHQILLKNPPPNPQPKLRFIRSCSSPLAPQVCHDLEKAFDAPVLEAYAMTEAAHQMTSNPLPPGKRVFGSVGVGTGVEVRIVDLNGEEVPHGSEAEICVRGENVTKGYLNNPEANKSSFTGNGFFRTGDQGKQDDEGYIIITGRIKELINKGGEKISPIELDNVVTQHPSVSEAVSFAIPDEMYGQDIGIAVIPKDGQNINVDQLKGWLTQKVAKFKLPKKIYITKVMPKTPTGKIQRRMVAEAMMKQDHQKSKL